jgi:RNA polymerase sigma-70 factor (ECF subfamily)
MDQKAMTGTADNRNEAQIIASILAGNAHEFHDLIRPHERSVYIMALSLLHNEADAEDAAQEAFLKAFRNLARFRGESKFSTWLISIALNEARSRLRSKKAVKMDSLDEPSEVLERQEFRLLLQQAVTDLPLIYREIFLLRDVEELSVNESAEVLGITVASAKVRLHRARIMLQKKLVPQLKKANPKRRWFSWS